MGCCGQNTTGAGAAAVDTGKRVNYTKGMLLGVDDFVQDQAWHIARRHELAREVLGYGTVRGLKVAIDAGAARVRVTPGVALMPSGTPVCVPAEQCCDIDAWLAKHWDNGPWGKGIAERIKSLPFPAPLAVYAVLAYDTCLTDLVPVPGEPCRSEEDLTAASRIADCFRLELWLDAPEQTEENAVRDFADWLARVPVDIASPPLSDEAFQQQLRDAAQAWLQPTSPPPGDFMFGSPPAGLGTTDELLRAALRLWTTELRPLWRARFGCGPNPVAPGGRSDTLLLAALQLSVHGDRRADTAVAIDETTRPVLLSLRMVQELIAQNAAPEPASSVEAALAFGLAPEVGGDPAYARADHQHGTPVLPLLAGDVEGPIEANEVVALRGDLIAQTAPADEDVLVFRAGQWEPEHLQQPSDAVPTALTLTDPGVPGTALDFSRADHKHALPALPTLAGDVTGAIGSNTVERLRGVLVDPAAPTTAGQVLTAQPLASGLGWKATSLPAGPQPGAVSAQTEFGLPPNNGAQNTAFARADHSHGTPTLSGDVSALVVNNVQETRVERLQGQELRNTAPVDKQVLTFNGTSWGPADAAGGSGPPAGTTAPPALAFGVAGAVGTGAAYALSNHTHTLPALPALPALPELGGDLSGAIGDGFIERLQKVPLKAPSPTKGDVLSFDGQAWIPAPAGTGADRGMAIIAAGEVAFTMDLGKVSTRPSVKVLRPLGGLFVTNRDVVFLQPFIRIDLHARPADEAPANAGYILKITPTLPPNYLAVGGQEAPQILPRFPLSFGYAAGEVVQSRTVPGQIDFAVLLFLAGDIASASFDFIFQVEVTRYAVAR